MRRRRNARIMLKARQLTGGVARGRAMNGKPPELADALVTHLVDRLWHWGRVDERTRYVPKRGKDHKQRLSVVQRVERRAQDSRRHLRRGRVVLVEPRPRQLADTGAQRRPSTRRAS